ncbi:transcription termination factor MTERF8, chloroplastic-like [Primulina huaijiensis]|uniref:transcription termination factor MTERF8, chloroplastic-like n=1 Tax=Primulina huaijiensis TaxID=1492673 RepID=UPI003CC78EBC
MFRRPILCRIGKIQFFANFCSLENGKRSLVNSRAGISLSKSEPVSSKKISPGKELVISYLVNSCGLTPERAVSASGKLHFDSPDKANAVLRFLEKHGFSKTQIAELVSRRPLFLLANPEKSFLPKIEFLLRSAGFSEPDMVEAVVKHPAYLARSLENQLAPVYEYIEGIVGSRKAGILLRRGSWIFDHGLDKKLIDNVALLRELGVPESCIEFALFHYPDVVTRKHDSFKKIVSEIEGMGFNPLKTAFVTAMHSRTGKGNIDVWERCYETYSNWGWSKDDIYMAFRKHPNCMLLSEKKISRFLDFVANKMGRDSRTIARVPYIIFYSMEKRIIPRYSVLHHLFLNGFVKKNWSLATVMCPTEEKFLENYAIRYLKELPQLLQLYRGETSGGV